MKTKWSANTQRQEQVNGGLSLKVVHQYTNILLKWAMVQLPQLRDEQKRKSIFPLIFISLEFRVYKMHCYELKY